jgi:hypothetical protein
MILVALSLILAAAPAGSAWKGASWGMTESQVLAAVPGSVSAVEPGHYNGGILGSVEIPNVEIQQTPLHVTFALKNHHLVIINFFREMESLQIARVHFDDLKQGLTEKYGPTPRTRTTVLEPEATWKGATSVVQLSLKEIRDSGFIPLHYGPLSELAHDDL